MMLLYGLVRGLVSVLRWKARRAQVRAKALYEQLKSAFESIETDCKAEEVSLGRPVDYTSQLRLLKAFEKSETARQQWLRTEKRVENRKKLTERVNGFQNARLPYTFGLIDMTVVMRAIEYLGMPQLGPEQIVETVKIWVS
ncbi:MAG: hypothetical protein AB8G99_21680 [Planctomycetaceae bacterium]